MGAISVDVALGEGAQAAAPAQDRLAGGVRPILLRAGIGLILGLLIAPTLGAGIAAVVLLTWGPETFAWLDATYRGAAVALQIAAAILGWEIGQKIGLKRQYERYLTSLAARGAPANVTTRFRLAADGFHIETERVSHRASWAAVLEVFDGPEHWLVQLDTLTVAVPKRAFADAGAERAFLARLAHGMPAEARARSVALTARLAA